MFVPALKLVIDPVHHDVVRTPVRPALIFLPLQTRPVNDNLHQPPTSSFVNSFIYLFNIWEVQGDMPQQGTIQAYIIYKHINTH